MDKLVTMIQDAGNLYDALVEMRENQETKTDGSGTDFKRLAFCAKSAPFHGHELADQDEFIRRAYLRILAGLVSQTQAQRREAKIIHIGRILAAMPDGNLESLFTDAATITTEDMESFRESLPEELRHLFLFDLLLLCWLDGEPEEAELRYAAGYMSAFAASMKQCEALAKAIRAVLEQDREALFGLAGEVDSARFVHYLDQSECAVVLTLEEARQIKGKPVIIFNAEISNLDLPIDMDEFPAKNVEFRGCTFRNMQGLFAEKTPVKIVDCLFEECEVERNLLALCNAEIRDTDFVKCKATNIDSEHFHLFSYRNSIIINCIFKEIFIPTGSNCGLLGAKETTISNCNFMECKRRQGSGWGQWQRFIAVESGKLTRCGFRKCSTGSYLFNNVDSVIDENTIEGCCYNMLYDSNETCLEDINAVIKMQREWVRTVKS